MRTPRIHLTAEQEAELRAVAEAPFFPATYTELYTEALKLWKENKRLTQEIEALRKAAP